MNYNAKILLLSCVILKSLGSFGYKIAFLSAGVGSHIMYMGRLAHEVMLKGHDVTFVLPENVSLPDEIRVLGLNILEFNDPEPVLESESVRNIVRNMARSRSVAEQLSHIKPTLQAYALSGFRLLEDKAAMKRLQDGQFDHVIVDIAVLPYFYVPYIIDASYSYVSVNCDMNEKTTPLSASFIPSVLLPFTDDMNFWQRLTNLAFKTMAELGDISQRVEIEEYMPWIEELSFQRFISNADLCLKLRDNFMDFVRPEMPDIVPIATIMGRPGKPLPTQLQSLISSAPHGVIIVSFGTIVSSLPLDIVETMIEAFRDIEQTVIMKYTKNIDNLPSNVHLLPWIPQNDLLAQDNVRLFISHCGMNSIIEAVYHGTPLVAIPFAYDQHNNAALVEAKGLGVRLHLHSFNATHLKQAIADVLGKPSYKRSAGHLSTVFRSLQTTENTKDPVYWIEHVIEYGTSHLKSRAAIMPKYQFLMLDGIFFMAAVIMTFVTCSLYVSYLILRYLYKKRQVISPAYTKLES